MKKLRISFLSLFILLHSVSAIAGEIGEVEIHGFISQGYLKTDRNNYMADTEDGTFQFNEMGINFQTRVSEKLKIGTQFIARDLGTIGNDEIKIDWAFADYRYSNIIGVRAGSLKIPIGFYNEARDVDSVRTNIILPPSIYAEEWRDVFVGLKGVGIYGRLPGRVSYVLQNGTLDLPLDSGYMRIVTPLLIRQFPWKMFNIHPSLLPSFPSKLK